MSAPTQCYYFDGAGDYVTVADHANFDVTAALSVGCWLRRDPDDFNTASYLMHRASTFSLFLDEFNRVGFWISGVSPVLYSNHRIGPEHIAFVAAVAVEAGAHLFMQIFVNGKLDSAQWVSSAALPAGNANPVVFGYDGAGNYFKGSLSSFFMTSDQVTPQELKAIYESDSGQVTGFLDNIIIDIDTEGDLVNNESTTVPDGVATNAVPRTYMDLWQSHSKNNGIIVIPEAETLYNTRKQVVLKSIHWHGDTIVALDQLVLQNWAGSSVWSHQTPTNDTGGYWTFDDWKLDGLRIATLGHGIVHIEVE
jgi:hypothetical protein